MKKILLLWAYWQKNIWDEALLEASIRIINKNETHTIYSNSMTPWDSHKEYPEVDFFHTNIKSNIVLFLKYFITSDVIIYWGGSLLVELKMNKLNKRTPLIRMFLINTLWKILRKKIIYLWIWAEHVSLWFSVFLMKQILKRSDLFYMRDNYSQQVLRDYGVGYNKISVIPDIVHILWSTENIIASKDKYNICIIPVCRVPDREKNYDNYLASLSLFIVHEIKKWNNITLCWMRFEEIDELNDIKAIEDIKSLVSKYEPSYEKNIKTITQYLSPENFSLKLLEYDMIYSSRFHGLIYSINNGIPPISLSDFAKCKYLLEEEGLSRYSLNEKTLKSTSLIDIQLDLENNYVEICKNIDKMNNNKTSILKKELTTIYNIL